MLRCVGADFHTGALYGQKGDVIVIGQTVFSLIIGCIIIVVGIAGVVIAPMLKDSKKGTTLSLAGLLVMLIGCAVVRIG